MDEIFHDNPLFTCSHVVSVGVELNATPVPRFNVGEDSNKENQNPPDNTESSTISTETKKEEIYQHPKKVLK